MVFCDVVVSEGAALTYYMSGSHLVCMTPRLDSSAVEHLREYFLLSNFAEKTPAYTVPSLPFSS